MLVRYRQKDIDTSRVLRFTLCYDMMLIIIRRKGAIRSGYLAVTCRTVTVTICTPM